MHINSLGKSMHGKTLRFSSIIMAVIIYIKTRLNSICDRKNAILIDELVFSDRNFDRQICNSKKTFGPSIIFIFIFIQIFVEIECCSVRATNASTVSTCSWTLKIMFFTYASHATTIRQAVAPHNTQQRFWCWLKLGHDRYQLAIIIQSPTRLFSSYLPLFALPLDKLVVDSHAVVWRSSRSRR